jgi:hypothetical protein
MAGINPAMTLREIRTILLVVMPGLMPGIHVFPFIYRYILHPKWNRLTPITPIGTAALSPFAEGRSAERH